MGKNSGEQHSHPGVENVESKVSKVSNNCSSTSLKIPKGSHRNFGREAHRSEQLSTQIKMQRRVNDPIMDLRESGPVKRKFDTMLDGARDFVFDKLKEARA